MRVYNQVDLEAIMSKQRSILNDFNAEEEWVGMPEFHQVKVEPFSTIKIRFETEQDLNDFAELIEQWLSDNGHIVDHVDLYKTR